MSSPSEYAADRYALGVGLGPQLAAALEVLSGVQRRRVGIVARLLSRHPGMERRIAALGGIAECGPIPPRSFVTSDGPDFLEPRHPDQEWSPECVRCATGPSLGARFCGNNKLGVIRWQPTCVVTAAEVGREFTFQRRARQRPPRNTMARQVAP